MHSGVDRGGGCFGCSSTPFMPEARGLGYCYILPEDSADLEHLVYLWI